MRKPRPYPTKIADVAWAVGAPSLPVIATQSLQPPSDGHMLFNALDGIGRPGTPGRLRPTDFPPWEAVAQQPQRWVDGGWFGHHRHRLTVSPACSVGQHRPAWRCHWHWTHSSRAAKALRVPAMPARHARKGRDTTAAVAVGSGRDNESQKIPVAARHMAETTV